ncbi:eukaryotic translation initiation factor 3c [Medicago truncatula]|uniref:Eukaryotic translation initiation factor 3c n=1 Tax=Medicago truncatula TaxID=3880 RepID=A0A072U8S3_MEDTR|nr:eukaryotic translation initiation factor 3c [Medicago truncatula]
MDNNDWGRLQESINKINKQLEKFRCVSEKDVIKMMPKLKNNNNHDKIIDADPSITWDTFNKKFKDLVAARRRNKTGRFEQVEQLPTYQNCLMLIQASLVGMCLYVWKKCVQNILVILDILAQQPNIKADDSVEPDEN